jgi:HlyD family secretion protein
MKQVIRLVAVLIVAAGAVGVIYAYVGSRDTDSNGFKLVGAEIGSITEKALAVGQIQPRERFRVKSKISGIVKRCFVEVGDEVRAGDALFEIAPDPTPQELLFVDHGLRSAQASFEKAEADYGRGLELHEDGLTSKGDLDALEELHELAQVALEQARDNRELTRSGKVTGGTTEVERIIRSTAEGTILSREVNPGDPVVPLTSYQPGTELASVADMGDLIFKGTVDEIDVGKIAEGMPCRIKVGALPGAPVTGVLSRIAPQAKKDAGATLFDVEIELDPDQDVYLRAGYSANAEVVIRGKDDIVILPERLVIFDPDTSETFVEIPGIGPEAEPVKVAVQLGLSDGISVEITEGLSAGDQVIQRPPREVTSSIF